MIFGNKRIFLDHASGTPVDKEVIRAMHAYVQRDFYNPSALYRESVQVHKDMESARNQFATVLACRPTEITFVDGATEGNNLAIMGSLLAWQEQNPGKQAHVITSAIEHPSILEACKYLERTGVAVTYLSVDEVGTIQPQELKQALQENTVLVSIGYVNGEIGTIQDLRGIAKTIRHYRKQHGSAYPYFHTDAVQAVNYCELIEPTKLGIDMMTTNGSKIYGPKKIGALYIKTGIQLTPLLYGGGQERALRPGTENVPSVIGFVQAFVKARLLRESEVDRLGILQELCLSSFKKEFSEAIINGEGSFRTPHIVNISFPNISHEELLLRLDAEGILCSAKSACKSGEEGDSHVILALRKNDHDPTGSLRFSFGRETTTKDIHILVKKLRSLVKDMYQTYEQYRIE